MTYRILWIPSIAAVLVLVLLTGYHVWAHQPSSNPFRRTWLRTDLPIATQRESRTWMWGPNALTPLLSEDYAESPHGQRVVQYYDKSRMEVTHPDQPDDGGPWYVTNGLLAVELISGRMQMGDTTFAQHSPAAVNVAGDENDAHGPTYASLTGLLTVEAGAYQASITRLLHRDGTVSEDAGKAAHAVSTDAFIPQTAHWVAKPFWEFMHSDGLIYRYGSYLTEPLFESPFYATGYPITEAYWAEVQVRGTRQDVLLQCFERRCLTYTPGNPDGWQVEAGNIGRHYYTWRYGDSRPVTAPQPDPTFVPECHPSYPDFCLPPPPPSLDCDDLEFRDFTVLHDTWIVNRDPHGFDPDEDGIGCEAVPVSPTPTTPPDPQLPTVMRAWVSNETPPQYSSVTVFGEYIVGGQKTPGARMEAFWEIQTADGLRQESCAGSTNASGIAHCSRLIGAALPGVPVVITVQFWWDYDRAVTITFTPQ